MNHTLQKQTEVISHRKQQLEAMLEEELSSSMVVDKDCGHGDESKTRNICLSMKLYRECLYLFAGGQKVTYSPQIIKLYLRFLQSML